MNDAFDPNDPDFAGLKPSASAMASRVAFQLLRIAVPSVFGSLGAFATYVLVTGPVFAAPDRHTIHYFKYALGAPFLVAFALGGGALVLFDRIAARLAPESIRRDAA